MQHIYRQPTNLGKNLFLIHNFCFTAESIFRTATGFPGKEDIWTKTIRDLYELYAV